MVTVEQVQRGCARYLEGEFLAKISGWKRWAFGAGAAMVLDGLPDIVNQYRENAIVSSLGILTPDGIDLDRVYPYLRAQAEKGDVTFDLPIVGAVTLNAGDVEKLYRCIQEG